MDGLATHDPIVAISSEWQAAPVGIVRATGVELSPLLNHLALSPSVAHGHQRTTLTVADITLPVDVFWFPAGRSYTGQSVLELHTCGNLAWLRAVAGALLEAGARRAQPGEFTARAFLNGRLEAEQTEGVLALIHASDAQSARAAARSASGRQGAIAAQISDDLLALIGAIEAGIDFVDEEDIRFIDADTLRRRVAGLLEQVQALRQQGQGGRVGCPHVALLGPPNAGKSTLFNALLGQQRAIVSPILGTTRDVLTAEVRLGDRTIVLQDTAGLGDPRDALDAAAQRETRALLSGTDVVLWVEDGRLDVPMPEDLLEGAQVVRVRTHSDLSDFRADGGVAVSGVGGAGLAELRNALRAVLDRQVGRAPLGRDPQGVVPHLEQILADVPATSENLPDPELLALELRGAWERFQGPGGERLAERTLGWIYGNFCLGK